MLKIRTLVPTIFDALRAIEQGCRKVQDDAFFLPNMATWMRIEDGYCMGCLATCTIMEVTGKTGSDLTSHFSYKAIVPYKATSERARAFGIKDDDFGLLENAIDLLRFNELYALLKFYGLENHQHTWQAVEWLHSNRNKTLHEGSKKEDLNRYAIFLREQLIPKMEQWFAVDK